MAATLPFCKLCLSSQGREELIKCADAPSFECEGNKALIWSSEKNQFLLRSGKIMLPLAAKYNIPILLWLIWLRKTAMEETQQ